MTTLTGEFIQDILEKSNKAMVDDEILSEAQKLGKAEVENWRIGSNLVASFM